MLKIQTAQYRVVTPDRLDITAKSIDPIGKAFAPSWDIIMGLKDSSINAQEYTDAYHKQMVDSYVINRDAWDSVAKRNSVTFACFCKPGAFCHRILLAALFHKLYLAVYLGEVTNA